MSQKSGRRTRRQTTEEEAIKTPTPKPVEIAEEVVSTTDVIEIEDSSQQVLVQETLVINGDETKIVIHEDTVITNGEEKEVQAEKSDRNSGKGVLESSATGDEGEIINLEWPETEPVLINDEVDPELAFEANSDLESGHSSPTLSRCKTRRSLNRNAPTPKTPKSILEEDFEVEARNPIITEENGEEEEEDLDVTFDSCADISTKVHVGGDSTRLEISSIDTNSFLQGAKNKSFGEALRNLSTRRAIRPTTYESPRNERPTSKANLESHYSSRFSVERVSSVGLKRKSDEDEEDGGKRFKPNSSPSYFSRFRTPFLSIRKSFRGEPINSPTLTGYKDEKCFLEKDGNNSQICEVETEEKRWCSIM